MLTFIWFWTFSVLAPTRELAVQIQQVAIEFGSSTHIRTCCTVGGIDKKPQEADLLKGYNFFFLYIQNDSLNWLSCNTGAKS